MMKDELGPLLGGKGQSSVIMIRDGGASEHKGGEPISTYVAPAPLKQEKRRNELFDFAF